MLLTLRMPVEQHVITAVSGFVACIADLFDADYDGWGCEAQSAGT